MLDFEIMSIGYSTLYGDVVPESYAFRYMDEAGSDVRGYIPVDFSSKVMLDTAELLLNTRRGISGPEYQIRFPTGNAILVDWMDDLDNIWIVALQKLENEDTNFHVNEAQLDALDTDPRLIFGLANSRTQQLIKSDGFFSDAMLMCADDSPSTNECFAYLKADPTIDSKLSWIIESFKQAVLPYPWRSLRDAGNFILYRNDETGESTLRHPFYDYFIQLLGYCRHASKDECIKVRLSRLFWRYGDTVNPNPAAKQPIISPTYISELADILELDVIDGPELVTYLRESLKKLVLSYGIHGELYEADIATFLKDIPIAKSDKSLGSRQVAGVDYRESVKLACSDCHMQGHLYCLNCSDPFCDACFSLLHASKSRAMHGTKRFVLCSVCKVSYSIFQCSYSFSLFCADCYFTYSRSLPVFLDIQPFLVDYSQGSGKAVPLELDAGSDSRGNVNRQFGGVWYTFYDATGVKYFYNFTSQEIARRPQQRHVIRMISESGDIHRIAMSRAARNLAEPLYTQS